MKRVLLEIFESLILVGAIQGFVLALFLLFSKSHNKSANRILAVLIGVVSLDSFSGFVYFSQQTAQYPTLMFIAEPLFTLQGPLFFLYTRKLAEPQFKFPGRYILFFLPAIIEILLWLPFYFGPTAAKLQRYQVMNTEIAFWDGYRLIWGMELLYNLIFVLIAGACLRKYPRSIQEKCSDITRVRVRWLRIFIAGSLVVYVLQITLIFMFEFDLQNINKYFILFYCLLTLFFYGIGYTGLRRPEIFRGAEISQSAANLNRDAEKYAKSALDQEKADRYLQQLLHLMQNEKPYLKQNLTLRMLAENLSISTNHLSQILNDKMEQGFSHFVNSYRVKEARRLLTDQHCQHLTLLAIAYEAGFRSKSSFNRIFKAYLKMTPSQYRRMHRSDNASKA